MFFSITTRDYLKGEGMRFRFTVNEMETTSCGV